MSDNKVVHFIDDDPRGSLLTSLQNIVEQMGHDFAPHFGRDAINDCLKTLQYTDTTELPRHFFLVDIAIPLSPLTARQWDLQRDMRGLNGLVLLQTLIRQQVNRKQLSLISNLDDVGQKEADAHQVSFFSKYNVNLIEVKAWLYSGAAGEPNHVK